MSIDVSDGIPPTYTLWSTHTTNTYYGKVFGLDDTFTHDFLKKPYSIETDTEINELFLELDIKDIRTKKLKEIF